MVGAIDDILFHVKRISPVVRMLILGAIGFAAASLLYGSRGPDTGVMQFVLFGIGGLVPSDAVVMVDAHIRRHAAGGAFDVTLLHRQ